MSFYRWCFRNRTAVYFALFITVFALSFVCGLLGIPLYIIIPAVTAFAFLFLLLLNNISLIPLKRASEKHDRECDPEPLLEECGLLYREQAKKTDVTYVGNKGAALLSLGRAAEAAELMEGFNKETLARLPALLQTIYFNNLTSAYTYSGNTQYALVILGTAKEKLAGIRNRKARKRAERVLRMTEAELRHSLGDDGGLPELLAELSADSTVCKRNAVTIANLMAEIALKQGDYNEAGKQLRFVIANGNKLWLVSKARETLDKIPQ